MPETQYIPDQELMTGERGGWLALDIMVGYKSIMPLTEANNPEFMKELRLTALQMQQFLPTQIYVVDYTESRQGATYSNRTGHLYIPRITYDLPPEERKAMMIADHFARVEQHQTASNTGNDEIDQCNADKRAMEVVSRDALMKALEKIGKTDPNYEGLHGYTQLCERNLDMDIAEAERCLHQDGIGDWLHCLGSNNVTSADINRLQQTRNECGVSDYTTQPYPRFRFHQSGKACS
jgi:hypothetical protein